MLPAEKVEPTEENRRPFIEPGWYRDLSNEEYHGSFGWSSSQLKTLIEKTPAHLLSGLSTHKEPTANMALGTAVHSLVLEPATFAEEFAVSQKFDKRTKIGKAQAAEFEAANAGKILIDEVALDKAQAMACSVLSDPYASAILEGAVPESSVYWWYNTTDADDDTKFKTLLKVRPDALSPAHSLVIDLKTTADASYSGFIKSIQNFYYHVSAAMYLEGVNQCKPLLETLGNFAYTKFVFICVENVEPYCVALYELPPEYIDLGKLIYRRCLHSLKRGNEQEWPGYPQGIRIIEPPPWASRGYIV